MVQCVCVCVCVRACARLVTRLCLTLCDLMGCSLPGSSVHVDKTAGVGSHFLLQGIFPTQGSNLRLLSFQHWPLGPLPLSHLGGLYDGIRSRLK